jgi:hypothetical protein
MAYLPTVEFGPGITSATEIRNAWPTLNDKRKTAMVMSLYPVTQKNPALAANVVKMLDMGMGAVEGLEEAQLAGHLDVTGVLVGNHYDHGMLGPVKVTKVNGAESIVTAKSDGRAYKVATSTLRKRISTHTAAHNAYRFSESEFKELDPRNETVKSTPKVPFDNKYTTSTTMTDRKLARRSAGWKDMDTHMADVARAKKAEGMAEGSEENDNLVSTLNSFGYYSDNGSVYVNDAGDKLARIGSNWKHQSGQRGAGAEELGNFLDSIQTAVESNVSESADYLPEK